MTVVYLFVASVVLVSMYKLSSVVSDAQDSIPDGRVSNARHPFIRAVVITFVVLLVIWYGVELLT